VRLFRLQSHHLLPIAPDADALIATAGHNVTVGKACDGVVDVTCYAEE